MSEHKPIGKTARGLAVYPVTHPSYSHLERTHAVGADAQHLAKLAQAAHPSYRAVDHEEASVMHHARRNMQAARAHEAASLAMSKSLPPEMLPAPDTSLAWVYEGATPDMTPEQAATAIQAATLGWTQQDHLEAGALQHHLAIALGDEPDRQAVCSAAAFMHVAAAGLNPGSLLNKGLDPKVLRPKLGTKPVQIGKTRSGKPIYNMFTHPAHASFTTADHVDHIEAMAAHQGKPKVRKSAVSVQIEHQKLNLLGCGLRAAQEPVMSKSEAVSILEDFLSKSSASILGRTSSGKAVYPASHSAYSKVHALKTMASGPKKRVGVHDAIQSTLRAHGGYSAKDHAEAGALHEKAGNIHLAEMHNMASGYLGAMKRGMSKSGEGSHGANVVAHRASCEKNIFTFKQKGDAKIMKSEAVSILEDFLAKSNNIIGKTSSGVKVRHPSHSDYKVGGTHPKFRFQGLTKKDHEEAAAVHEASPYKGSHNAMMVHRAFASGHVGKLAKSGEGSRGGKIIGRTRSGRPIYGAGGRHMGIKTVNARGDSGNFKSNLGSNTHSVEQSHKDYSKQDHLDAAAHLRSMAKEHKGGYGEGFFNSVASAHKHVAAKKAKKSMSKSGIMGMPVDLGDMQGSPIDGSYVDSMGGSHDLFMQQAELANCPTMWAPIATVPEN